MLFFLPAIIVAFFSSILTIKILLPLAPQIGLVDMPNDRKRHDGAIPLIGGISIFTGVLIASSLFVQQSQLLNLYLISSALLVFIGTMDDIYDLNVAPRMIFQGLVAAIMVFGGSLYISDFGNLLSFGDVNIGSYGMIFTLLACITAINAFNMIDGIDGLAGSMGIITTASILILNIFSDKLQFVLLPIILIVATIPFLFYNVSHKNPRGKKIFMGDAGSMFMGLTVIWLLAIGTQGDNPSFHSVTALWLIAVPLMDMFAIMIRRMRKGCSPFQADNGHLHHICMDLGLTSRQSLWVISGVAILFSFIGLIGELFVVPQWIMLLGFILLFFIYSQILSYVLNYMINNFEQSDKN